MTYACMFLFLIRQWCSQFPIARNRSRSWFFHCNRWSHESWPLHVHSVRLPWDKAHPFHEHYPPPEKFGNREVLWPEKVQQVCVSIDMWYGSMYEICVLTSVQISRREMNRSGIHGE
jgi:hypothetical protein